MPPFDKIVQNAAEKLYGDERLRSNLSDAEAKIILDWAARWVAEQTRVAPDEASAKQIAQAEITRVRQTAAALNALAAKNTTPRLADAMAAIESVMQPTAPLTRAQVLMLATAFANALWKMRANKK